MKQRRSLADDPRDSAASPVSNATPVHSRSHSTILHHTATHTTTSHATLAHHCASSDSPHSTPPPSSSTSPPFYASVLTHNAINSSDASVSFNESSRNIRSYSADILNDNLYSSVRKSYPKNCNNNGYINNNFNICSQDSSQSSDFLLNLNSNLDCVQSRAFQCNNSNLLEENSQHNSNESERNASKSFSSNPNLISSHTQRHKPPNCLQIKPFNIQNIQLPQLPASSASNSPSPGQYPGYKPCVTSCHELRSLSHSKRVSEVPDQNNISRNSAPNHSTCDSAFSSPPASPTTRDTVSPSTRDSASPSTRDPASPISCDPVFPNTTGSLVSVPRPCELNYITASLPDFDNVTLRDHSS